MSTLLEALDPLLKVSVKRSYPESSMILYQGEVPRNACILIDGVVKVYGISEQGDEQVISFHIPGEFFPSSWIFGKSASTMFFYEAVLDSTVAFVPRSELIRQFVSVDTNFHVLLDYFTTNYSASLVRIYALGQSKATKKLLYTLYYLCERYGVRKSSTIEIPLKLTHQNIAAMIGLTRETTSSELSKMKKAGILTYVNQHYAVRIDLLMKAMGEDGFQEMHIKV